MDDQSLDRALRSIGKACFIDYFDILGDDRRSVAEAVDELCRRSRWTPAGSRIRILAARRIFAAGRQLDALRIVAGSRVAPEKAEAARRRLV